MVLRWHFTNVNTSFDVLFFIETYDKDHYEKIFKYKINKCYMATVIWVIYTTLLLAKYTGNSDKDIINVVLSLDPWTMQQ